MGTKERKSTGFSIWPWLAWMNMFQMILWNQSSIGWRTEEGSLRTGFMICLFKENMGGIMLILHLLQGWANWNVYSHFLIIQRHMGAKLCFCKGWIPFPFKCFMLFSKVNHNTSFSVLGLKAHSLLPLYEQKVCFGLDTFSGIIKQIMYCWQNPCQGVQGKATHQKEKCWATDLRKCCL